MTARAAVEVLPIYALHRFGPRIVNYRVLIYTPLGDTGAPATCYSGELFTEMAVLSNISQLPLSSRSCFSIIDHI